MNTWTSSVALNYKDKYLVCYKCISNPPKYNCTGKSLTMTCFYSKELLNWVDVRHDARYYNYGCILIKYISIQDIFIQISQYNYFEIF